MRTVLRFLGAVVLLSVLLFLGKSWPFQSHPFQSRLFQASALEQALAKVVPVANQPRTACPDILARQPFVLLALGQSNAGNHGAIARQASEPVALVSGGECMLATDPLPGSTGTGGSIWSHLSQQLSLQQPQRLWVFSVMGMDATSVRDWTHANSPLREHLVRQVRALVSMGFSPNLVLWQQGEADARAGTDVKAYADALHALASTLKQAGSDAPILLARSTTCRSAPHAGIRAAVQSSIQSDPRFRAGPDTDALQGVALRPDGCHFSAQGLEAAAQAWAATIAPFAHPR